jgi:hypothetical protein
MKIDADEKELFESVERGEWKSAGGGKRERTRYTRYAKATFRKDRRLTSGCLAKTWRRSRSGRSRKGRLIRC